MAVPLALLSPNIVYAESEFVYRFEVPAKTKVDHLKLPDAHAVVVVLSYMPEDLEAQLTEQRRDEIDYRITALPFGAAEVLFWHSRPIKNYTVANKKGRLEIVFVVQDSLERVREHVAKALPKHVPSAFVADRFRQPETFVRRRRFGQASRLLIKLREEFALQAWATLRLVDILLLTRSDERAACRGYQDVLDSFPTRTSGILARFRLYVLRCPNSDIDDLELVRVLQQLRRLDGSVGRFLWSEAVFALSFVKGEADLSFALAQLIKGLGDAGTRRARRTTISRLLRIQSSPYAIARLVARHASELRKHPEGAWIQLRGLNALNDLDLPEKVIEFSEVDYGRRARGPLWQVRFGAAQVQTLRLGALRLAGHQKAFEKALAKYTKRYKSPPELEVIPRSTLGPDDLESAQEFAEMNYRLRALRAAVNAEDRGRRRKGDARGDTR